MPLLAPLLLVVVGCTHAHAHQHHPGGCGHTDEVSGNMHPLPMASQAPSSLASKAEPFNFRRLRPLSHSQESARVAVMAESHLARKHAALMAAPQLGQVQQVRARLHELACARACRLHPAAGRTLA